MRFLVTLTGIVLFSAGAVSASSNIALQATAGADSYYYQPTYPASLINDGNENTGWTGGYTYDPIAGNYHWASLTWASPKKIESLKVTFPGSNGYYYPKEFKLQVWNGGSWADLAHVSGNSQLQYQLTLAQPIVATAVRLYYIVPTQYDYDEYDSYTQWAVLNEFEVIGDSYVPLAEIHNIVANASVTVDSYYWYGGYPETNITDGNDSTQWISAALTVDHYVELTWNEDVYIDQVVFKQPSYDDQYGYLQAKDYDIERWDTAAASWVALAQVRGAIRSSVTGTSFATQLYFNTFSTSKLRLHVLTPTQYAVNTSDPVTMRSTIKEIEVLGVLNPVPSDCTQAKTFGYRLAGDINGDCYVNFTDMAQLALSWLDCVDPANENCSKPWR